MTADQYSKAKKKLSLSHEKLAPCLGISRRQSIRYAMGQTEIPKAIGIVLQLAADGDLILNH